MLTSYLSALAMKDKPFKAGSVPPKDIAVEFMQAFRAWVGSEITRVAGISASSCSSTFGFSVQEMNVLKQIALKFMESKSPALVNPLRSVSPRPVSPPQESVESLEASI